jgi:hypothetical protein
MPFPCQQALQRNSVPIVSTSALSGFVGSDLFAPAFDRHVPSSFSLRTGTTRIAQSDWRGNIGEISARYRGWIPFAGYYAVDTFLGDEVEHGVRSALEH